MNIHDIPPWYYFCIQLIYYLSPKDMERALTLNYMSSLLWLCEESQSTED